MIVSAKSHDLIKVKISDVKFDDQNPNQMTREQMAGLRQSMNRWGYLTPIIIDQNNLIADGEHRLLVYKELGYEEIPAYRLTLETDSERRMIRQVMNKLHGDHESKLDAQELESLRKLDLLPQLAELIAHDENILKRLIADFHPDSTVLSDSTINTGLAHNAGTLALRWGIPPFSVLDRRTQTWQVRRRQWLEFGIASEQGREDVVLYAKHLNVRTGPMKDGKTNANYRPTVSVFDPVIAEIMIRWFCIPSKGAKILDPFSGGSVRGIVASVLGHEYTGVDLSQKQVDANEDQYYALEKRMPEEHTKPKWICGDSTELKNLVSERDYDFVLTSPPYFKVEHYSESKQDLNNMTWPQFQESYNKIIIQACELLKPNAFVAWNVGNARDPSTKFYVNQPDFTTHCFEQSGFHLQNEFAVIHPTYSLAFRVGGMFPSRRTVPRQHEYVLVFYNGKHQDIPPIDPQVVDIPVSQETETVTVTETETEAVTQTMTEMP